MRVALIVLAALVLAHARPCRAADNLAGQERLGARIGSLQTFDGVETYYGPGWDVTLLFNERLFSRLFLDVHVGALYLGDTRDPEIDDLITDIDNAESEMRMFFFSVGVLYGIPLGGPYTLATSLAAGVYSVSVAFTSDFVSDDFSQQYFGGNGGLGLVRRVGTNWSLEANVTVHYFGTGATNEDILWAFTRGTAEDPVLLSIDFGVVIDLR